MPASKTVHTLKVTLRRVEPQVWRRVEVRSDTKLSDLAPVSEAAMGWQSCHLHLFETPDGAQYSMPDDDWPDDELDERAFTLSSVLSTVRSELRFDYDFGDGWEHDVVVEKIEPAEQSVNYPRCIDGQLACPPEDCGGPAGYQHLRDVLADPTHDDHAGLTEWVGPGFDPTEFDAGQISDAMRARPSLVEW